MKIILYLDTGVRGFGIALREADSQGKVLYKVYENDRSSANLKLSSLVQEALEEIGSSVEEVATVVVSKGPGSFTGIRVGLSWVQGFCQGRSCKKVGVSSLELLAKYLGKKHKLNNLNLLLANTKSTAFLASLSSTEVKLKFLAEKDKKDFLNQASANLFMDASYIGLNGENALQVFDKETLALLCFDAIVHEMSPQILNKFKTDEVLEPLYLRKSSVEEKN